MSEVINKSSQSVELHISVPRHCEQYLQKTAASLGYSRAGKGNIRKLLIDFGSKKYTLIPEQSTDEAIEIRNVLLGYIDKCITFTVQVQNLESVSYHDILSANLALNRGGKYILQAHTNRLNRQEFSKIGYNWEIDLDRIVAIHQSSRPWVKLMPTAKIEFWLSSAFYSSYVPSHMDVTSIQSKYQNIEGVAIVREIYTSQIVISELLSYGNNCWLKSPIAIRNKLTRELKATLQRYLS
ncbi:hypothetical protein [Chamaesiphon sp.]|uniref:hypothetical protein n=1 Tax=Chamaesiphon sp. TaxID=2814140 RepID=UPI003593F5CD